MELLNCKDVAGALRVSARQVWKLLSGGRLPTPVRLGRSVRWRRDDIDRWVSMGCPNREAFEAAKGSGEGRAVRCA